jgi:hypothetical protein
MSEPTDPTSSRSPPDASGATATEEAIDPTWNDPVKVLDELARVDAELRPRRPRSGASVPRPEPVAAAVYSEDPTPAETELSPHLEERLELASASLVQMGAGLRAIDDQWRELRAAADRLEEQMEGAAKEMEFLRERAGTMPAGAAARGPLSSAAEALAARSAAHQLPVDAPYGQFTADRYRRTVDAVKDRRRSMAAWTIGLAVAISGALLTFTYLAHEGTPPLWLALLPLVWLIPVPFFLVSFLATQRLVSQNALDLAGGS